MKLRHREVKLPKVTQLGSDQTIILTQAAQLQSYPHPQGAVSLAGEPASPKEQEGRVGVRAWGLWEGSPQEVTSEREEEVRWTWGDAGAGGNFRPCKYPDRLKATCELKRGGQKWRQADAGSPSVAS